MSSSQVAGLAEIGADSVITAVSGLRYITNQALHRRKVADIGYEAALDYVTAEAQARMMNKIEPLLLEDEKNVCKRAMNSTHLNKPRRASSADYRLATGFEAVIGMLEWIGDDERLNLLLSEAHKED